MIERYFSRSPFLSFLPFAVMYVVIVYFRGSEVVYGDEERYLKLAENLCHGFYSPPPPNINLWSGPGYPLVVAPFVYFGLPQLWITLLNALFQYLSVVFLFKSLKLLSETRIAAILSISWGLMYNAWFWEMPLVATEPLTVFLCSLFAFVLIKSQRHSDKKMAARYTVFAGVVLGYLVLTKIVLGYVLLIAFVICLMALIARRTAIRFQLFAICLVALNVNLPYVFYTYHLTDKWFYWGNSGGLSLYWMSTPYENETGDWHGLELYQPSQAGSEVAVHHQDDFKYLSQFTGVQLDDELKRMAFENIQNHPFKYLRNCAANASRLLFDAPYYFASPTKMYVIRIFPMLLFLPVLIFSLRIVWKRFRQIPGTIRFLLLLMFFYFSITVLLSAYHRQFYVMIPWMMLLIGWAARKRLTEKAA